MKAWILSVFLLSVGAAWADRPVSFDEFDHWAERFVRADQAHRSNLEHEGKELAEKRREELLGLIRRDPRAAVESAVPHRVRKNLPESVRRLLEERVSAKGNLNLALTLSESGTPGERQHHLTIGVRVYRAYLYGRRAGQGPAENISVDGVAIGDEIALSEFPARAIEIDELEDLKGAGAKPKRICPVSGRLLPTDGDAEGGAALLAGEPIILCSGGHIITLNEQILAQEGTGTTSATPIVTVPLAWTTGTKRVLYIRVNYPDDLTAPTVTDMDAVNRFMEANSYGALHFVTTFTPVPALPKTKATYLSMESSSSGSGTNALRSDALAAAVAAGFDPSLYELDAVRYQGGPGSFTGMAYVKGKGVWLKTNSVGTANHEFGHNFGLYHANYWQTNDGTATGSGANVEYGDPFDTMGNAASGGDFNAYGKALLGWIPAASYASIVQSAGTDPSSTTVRIAAFDQQIAPTDVPYAVRVKAGRDFWVDLRQSLTQFSALMNGVELHWAPWASSAGGTHLLDTTPGSSGGKNDAPIAIGRTFVDAKTGVSITPLNKGGTFPETVDVRVDLATVQPQVQSMSISPTGATLATGGSMQFSVTAQDQFGSPASASQVAWQASCGQISASGAYVAPATGGSCQVKAVYGSVVSNAANLTVYAPVLSKIYLSPTSASLSVGQTKQFAASARDQYGYVMANPPAIAWSMSGTCGTVSTAGLFTATASGKCSVLAKSGSISGTASVSVGSSSPKGGGRK